MPSPEPLTGNEILGSFPYEDIHTRRYTMLAAYENTRDRSIPQKAAQGREQYVCVLPSFALLPCYKAADISVLRYLPRRTTFWYTALTVLSIKHAELSLCTPDLQLLSYHCGQASDVPQTGQGNSVMILQATCGAVDYCAHSV